MKKYIVIIPAIVILLFTGFRCGGSSSDSDTTVVSLSFERIDSAGLDPFKVTVTVRTNNTPVTGAVLERTVPKGTVSAITDNGDGTYSFTVIPAETGEYPVTVSYNGSSVTRTALVLLSVHSDWGQPMAVPGNYVNTEGYEDGVTISPDGEYLFVQYGPHYFSGIILSILDCGNSLATSPCDTHIWTNCTKGPVSSPERPGFFSGRFRNGTLLHNSNLYQLSEGTFPFFAPVTMFYGFKRQEDGTFAEPFYIAFQDENDAIINPFGMSFRMNSDGTATMVFSMDDSSQQSPTVSGVAAGTVDSKYDVYTVTITPGQNTIPGKYIPGASSWISNRSTPFNAVLIDFGSTGTDGNHGTQGNPHLYYLADGTVNSIWTDDEYDGDDTITDNDDDYKKISVYVLSGSFPSGTWTKVVLPSPVNTGAEEIQPFFNGTALYFTRDTNIFMSSFSGEKTTAGYGNTSNWGTPVQILGRDSSTHIGSIIAVGEPTLCTYRGEEYLYFVYAVIRDNTDPSGLPDLNMQAGFIRRK